MIIYIDSDFKCFTENGEGRTAAETDVFDGKCQAYIQGYRFVPEGETWTRLAGAQFAGEMITPLADYSALDAAQREYERQQISDYEAAFAEIETALGVNA